MRVAPPRASARTACQVPAARPPRPACARSPATTAPHLSRSSASAPRLCPQPGLSCSRTRVCHGAAGSAALTSVRLPPRPPLD